MDVFVQKSKDIWDDEYAPMETNQSLALVAYMLRICLAIVREQRSSGFRLVAQSYSNTLNGPLGLE